MLWRALGYGKRVRTVASVFGLRPGTIVNARSAARSLSAVNKELLRKPKLKLVIDETDLLQPEVRDVEVAEELRQLRLHEVQGARCEVHAVPQQRERIHRRFVAD